MSDTSDKKPFSIDHNTPKPGTPDSEKQYVQFFKKHGVTVKNSELAEEATRMADDPYSLFSLWRFSGSKDALEKAGARDMPRCMTALDFEAIDKTPYQPVDAEEWAEKRQPGLFEELATSNRLENGPKFSMAKHMASLQQRREQNQLIHQKTGLDPYDPEDRAKLDKLRGQDPLLPKAQAGEGALYITPETFQDLYGDEVEGGTGAWFDGPFYPESLRNHWMSQGELVHWQGNPARLLDPKVLYGEKLGSSLHEWHVGNVLKTMAYDKTKLGSKMLGVGFALWVVSIVVLKRYQLQYRDHMTAQLVFAERLNSLDDYYPSTEDNIHFQLRLKGYLQQYYEDEDEDDEL